MLLKAEKILSYDNTLSNSSVDEAFKKIKCELSEKLAEMMLNKDLIKIEIANELNDDFGSITKIKATVRAYHPDD